MKNLIIMGAGGLGREVLQWVNDINSIKKTWNILGFIDDNLNALNGIPCGCDVIGRISDWEPDKNQVFACAVAQPRTKEILIKSMKERGAVFVPVIHPTALIGDGNQIGEGLIAYPNAVITTNVKIGDFVTLLSSGIGHDAEVGSYTTICSFSDITGGVKIGKSVWIGTHCAVIPGRIIKDNAVLSAGSIVMTDVEENEKMIGNPARRMRF